MKSSHTIVALSCFLFVTDLSYLFLTQVTFLMIKSLAAYLHKVPSFGFGTISLNCHFLNELCKEFQTTKMYFTQSTVKFIS